MAKAISSQPNQGKRLFEGLPLTCFLAFGLGNVPPCLCCWSGLGCQTDEKLLSLAQAIIFLLFGDYPFLETRNVRFANLPPF
jgi:hypothetical protein